MKDDREQVLARIRASVRTGYFPSARASRPTGEAASALATDLVEQFTREAAALGVDVHLPAGEDDARQMVVELARASGAQEILAWEDAAMPLSGVQAAMRGAGFTPVQVDLPAAPEARRSKLAELERAGMGVTGALGGLAESGTLALVSGPGRSRLASLLPPVHVALLSRRALYFDLAALFAAHPVQAGSNLVLITGPSRTADIEQTLTIGVHGPREVHVILTA